MTERIPAVLEMYKLSGASNHNDFPVARLVPRISPYLTSQISMQTIGETGIGDLAWLLLFVAVIIILYLWRCYLCLAPTSFG